MLGIKTPVHRGTREHTLLVDPKQTVKMSLVYGSWHSFVLLRPKNKVKLQTQSAEVWICMGKWSFEILAIYFPENEKTVDNQNFLSKWASY